MISEDLYRININYSKKAMRNRPQINSPLDAYNALLVHWEYASMKTFKVLLMDYQCRLLSLISLSINGIFQITDHPGILLNVGVTQHARYLIIAHDSYAGYLDRDVVKLTLKLFHHAEKYDLIIKDHLLITDNTYWSMHKIGYLKDNHKL